MAPYSLPSAPDIPITPRLLRLIVEIEAFRARWQATHPLPEDRLLALRRVATIESIGASTRIEGALLTTPSRFIWRSSGPRQHFPSVSF